MITTLKTKTTQEDVYPNIDSANIPNDAITAPKISANAVTSGKIASNAVTTTKIATGAVTATKIGDRAVITTALADQCVTGAKIADETINGEAHIMEGSTALQCLKIEDFVLAPNYGGDYSDLLNELFTIFNDYQVLFIYYQDARTHAHPEYLTDISVRIYYDDANIQFKWATHDSDLYNQTDFQTFLGALTDKFHIVYLKGTKQY